MGGHHKIPETWYLIQQTGILSQFWRPGSSRSGCQHGQVLVQASVLACRQLPSPCVLLWQTDGTSSSYKAVLWDQGSTLMTSFNLLKASSPVPSQGGARASTLGGWAGEHHSVPSAGATSSKEGAELPFVQEHSIGFSLTKVDTGFRILNAFKQCRLSLTVYVLATP